jgi:hypothetical protein
MVEALILLVHPKSISFDCGVFCSRPGMKLPLEIKWPHFLPPIKGHFQKGKGLLHLG